MRLSTCSSSSHRTVQGGKGSLSINPRPNSSSASFQHICGDSSGRHLWGFPSMEDHHPDGRNVDVASDSGSDVFGRSNGNDREDESLSGEDTRDGVQCGKEADDNGPAKVCSRGHWKPAEDTKLRELVALYGPHNWKLIAEKLQSRSGITSTFSLYLYLYLYLILDIISLFTAAKQVRCLTYYFSLCIHISLSTSGNYAFFRRHNEENK